jgi:hypothetical protein
MPICSDSHQSSGSNISPGPPHTNCGDETGLTDRRDWRQHQVNPSATMTARSVFLRRPLRAQKADGAIFQAFCEASGESLSSLPADPKTIRAFIEHEVTAGK